MFVSEISAGLSWDELSALVTERGYKAPLMKDFSQTDVEPTLSREEAAYVVIQCHKKLGKTNPQG